MDKICQICSKPIGKSKSFVCGRECFKLREKNRRSKTASSKYAEGIPAGTIGGIHELMVAVDLLSKGFSVFRSVSPHSPFDLVYLRNGELFSVEVTSGYRNNSQTLCHPPKDETKFHVLAIVEYGGTITYMPPVD